MCHPMRAHWRHLANTSPQLKRRIDWFSHFFTAHGSVVGHVLSPNNCRFTWGICAPSNTCYLGPTRVHNPNSTRIGSAVFAQITADCRYLGAGRRDPQSQRGNTATVVSVRPSFTRWYYSRTLQHRNTFYHLIAPVCMYVCILRAGVQPTLDPYAEAL